LDNFGVIFPTWSHRQAGRAGTDCSTANIHAYMGTGKFAEFAEFRTTKVCYQTKVGCIVKSSTKLSFAKKSDYSIDSRAYFRMDYVLTRLSIIDYRLSIDILF
jgi:hypothetical protein